MKYELIPIGPLEKVVTCRDLIVLGDQTYTLEFVVLQNEVKETQTAIKTQTETIKQLDAQMVQMSFQLNQMNLDLIQDMKKIELEITRLVAPSQVAQMEQAEKDPVQAEINARNAAHLAEQERRRAAKRNSPKVAAQVKKLYIELTAKCHPDRTKDPQLHELFQPVKFFYETNDLANLKELAKGVRKYLRSRSHPNWFRKNCREQLGRLGAHLNNMLNQEQQMRSSQEYQLVKMLEQGQIPLANSIYRSHMMQRVEQLQEQLEAERRKRAPQPVMTRTQAFQVMFNSFGMGPRM